MLKTLYLLLEVLAVLVPVLLAVAFMTIIERKVLAATQRRVGPNVVGIDIQRLKKLRLFALRQKRLSQKRFYLISIDNNNEIINTLHKNRTVPVKNFDSKINDTCYNLTSTKQRIFFLNLKVREEFI